MMHFRDNNYELFKKKQHAILIIMSNRTDFYVRLNVKKSMLIILCYDNYKNKINAKNMFVEKFKWF